MDYSLPYNERRRLRRAQEQGQKEAQHLVAIETRERAQAVIDATPEHLRRPENIYSRLVAAHEGKAYRPEIAARLRRFKRLETEREKEIDAEMEGKLRQFEIESNPETSLARQHWETASAGADSEQERQEWARLKGRIDGGAASSYWDEARAILDARLARIREKIVTQAAKQAPLAMEAKELAAQQKATEALAKEIVPVESPNDPYSDWTMENLRQEVVQ
jgi:hypothetical protein